MIKFHGSGKSGRAAADYLEAEKDHAKRERANVEVLRGDPQLVAQVADSLDFKNRHTSGVIAWALEDNPTPEDIDKTLDSFEAFAWSGLESDRYAWSAVRHDEPDGKVHVHVFAARVDLETGKSLNIAPPGWQKDFITWCNAVNTEHGWARPDDPERKKYTQLPDHEEKINASRRKDGLADLDNPRVELTRLMELEIQDGKITDRADVITALQEYGEITRTGKNYISIKLFGADKAIRLKGDIYDQQFNAESHQQTQGETPGQGERDGSEIHARSGRPGEQSDRGVNSDRAELHRGAQQGNDAYAQAIERRGNYHRKKYKPVDQKPENPLEDIPVLHPAAVPVAIPDTDISVLRPGHLDQAQSRDTGRPPNPDQQAGRPRPEGMERRGQNAGDGETERVQETQRFRWRGKRPVDRRDREEMTHDRTGNQADQYREIDAIQARNFAAGIERHRRRTRELKEQRRRLDSKPGFLRDLVGWLHRAIAVTRQKNIGIAGLIQKVKKIFLRQPQSEDEK